MRGRVLAALPVLLLAAAAAAQAPPEDPLFAPGFPSGYALPSGMREGAVPAPEAVVGHRVGARYTSPEEIAAYAKALAAASPRVRVERYGTTPEGRQLLLVTVSSPEHLARLDERRRALEAARGDAAARRALLESAPAGVWITCSVHGDEPGGGEAALALLYHLAASREPALEEMLARLVVFVDVDANPDGRARHVAWSRSVTDGEPDAEPGGLENDPPWPEARFSHAGFDLNRDWAWATQPETRARVAAILRAAPQVFVDLHEMGPEASYFFPPGAEPVHPHVPERTRRSIDLFGRAVARAFDERGWSYFVRESFDLFYPAYGDSWPALLGMVGMTFEAAGAPGLAYRRRDGRVLTLTERAVKHHTALLATLREAAARRRELLADPLDALARRPGAPLFALPGDQDPGRLRRLAQLLDLQGVRVETTTAPLEARPGVRLPAGSLLVDTAQPHGRFAEAILEPGASLPRDFVREARARFLLDEPMGIYDVTAWSLPLAFGLRCIALPDRRAADGRRAAWKDAAPAPPAPARYGWLFPGGELASRGAAGRLLAGGARVQVVTRAARAGALHVAPGSFVVTHEGNDSAALEEAVAECASAAGARAVPLAGAWTDEGPAFGSSTVLPLRAPRVLLVTGDGVDPTSAGALELALTRDLGVRPMRARAAGLAGQDLSEVTVVILPHGGAPFRRELERAENAAALRRFVESGGVVVAVRGAVEALRSKALGLSQTKGWEPPAEKPQEKKDGEGPKSAAAGKPEELAAGEDPDLVRDLDRRPLSVPGAALRTRGVKGDPLLFGLAEDPVVLVVDGKPPRRLPRARGNVLSVVAGKPLASGFGFEEALERWAGAPVLQVESVGRGKVISFAIDPAFRGVWLGTEILFLNAVLLGPVL